jgi:hypothetical protein
MSICRSFLGTRYKVVTRDYMLPTINKTMKIVHDDVKAWDQYQTRHIALKPPAEY